jgi:hypothetical protein
MKLKSPSAYWSELDEKRRSEYRIVAAVLLGIFTLFTAIAVGSYFSPGNRTPASCRSRP